MSWNVRQATLDDWQHVKEMWAELKLSRHALRIDCTDQVFAHYFAVSQVSPNVRFLVLASDELGICAFAILEEIVRVVAGTQLFMCALHARPWTKAEGARYFDSAMREWAKSRGHSEILGYCNLDFPLQAYKRLHKVEPCYVVVRKEL